MKRFLLILAVMSAFISANAQSNQTYYEADTLTMAQLMADYVSLNNQVMQFRNYELASIGLGFGSSILAVGGYFVKDKDPQTAQGMLIAAGAMGVATIVTGIVGYTKIKRNRLEVTPTGIVYKLTPYE